MQTTSEEALWVLRAQSGEREALEQLLGSVLPKLRLYLLRLTGAPDADDVLQDVLVVVARKLRWLEQPTLFRPWVFRIASRAAWRHLRKQRQWAEEPLDNYDLDQLPSVTQPSGELLEELLASDALSPACRAVLFLHFKEEMPLADVAAVLELPVGTVKSRLAYGLSALRKQLGAQRRE